MMIFCPVASAKRAVLLCALITGFVFPASIHQDESNLLLIPAGKYSLGDEAGRYDEKPLVVVGLESFQIDANPVTNSQFSMFLASSGYIPQGPWQKGYQSSQDQNPVRFITWHDALAYASFAGRELPTEAQWETAMKLGKIREGSLKVREWVFDWYDRYCYQAYAAEFVTNPRGPSDQDLPELKFVKAGAVAGNERSTRKVVRGYSFCSVYEDQKRVSRRDAHAPGRYFEDVGFRTVKRGGRNVHKKDVVR